VNGNADGNVNRDSPDATFGAATRRWNEWIAQEIDVVHSAGQWRTARSFDAFGCTGMLDGRSVVSYASNDYLGLTTHPDVIARGRAALERWGTGAGASRLIVGSRPLHHELEAELASWRGTARAVIFTSGYAANLGVLSVLGGPDVDVFSDELNHASIVDGCRLGRSTITVFRHNDLEHLESLLTATTRRSLVVTEAVFSMDGDRAPVAELLALCSRHGAALILDEAHDVFGFTTEALSGSDSSAVLVRVGTLSKTLGSLGGFVACDGDVADLLINRARSFIFTTAPPPHVAATALAALDIVRGAQGAQLRARLHTNIERIRPGHGTPIIPVVLGDEHAALAAARNLLDQGILVPAIRPPTVPPGTSRLRVALSAAHTDEMLDALVTGLADIDPCGVDA
jgi:8-amino-7-oxononanoate synthase